MKIFSAQQMRDWDAYTIGHEPISSIRLMEKAAIICSKRLMAEKKQSPFVIFCGTGNNGGDGLAIARHLNEAGRTVHVFVVGRVNEASEDFTTNFGKLAESDKLKIDLLDEENADFEINRKAAVVDCIFGTGISRPVDGWRAQIINQINKLSNRVVAIDLPSGFLPDRVGVQPEAIIEADDTITFQTIKLAFLFPENDKYVGFHEVVDIGLSKEFQHKTDAPYHVIEFEEVASLLKPRDLYAHKNTHGHLQLIAGSKGKMGAAILSAKAAMRSGCGVVTAHVPKCGYIIMQTAIPEVMCELDESDDVMSNAVVNNSRSAIAIGPGLGKSPETSLALRRILQDCTIPMVIDADALNIISERTMLDKIPANSILTPHVGEFDRLFGKHDDSFSRFKTLCAKAAEYKINIVLKGAITTIACSDGNVYFNEDVNPGLATAGTGDVLTGIIGAMLAQGYAPDVAARAGVYIHSSTGLFAVDEVGEIGLMASDVVERIPCQIRTFFNPELF